MQCNAPIPLTKRPRVSEGSSLISDRDQRNNSQRWKDINTLSRQMDGLLQSHQKLLQQVSKQRRRIVGGNMPGGGGGGYMGEYDPTVAYTTGQTFKITAPLTITIASVNYIIAAGHWGVRPAASVMDSQGFGPWAGSLPVNPTTAGIDMDKMFFNAENTAPTMGTGLNSKLYAELITATCAT